MKKIITTKTLKEIIKFKIINHYQKILTESKDPNEYKLSDIGYDFIKIFHVLYYKFNFNAVENAAQNSNSDLATFLKGYQNKGKNQLMHEILDKLTDTNKVSTSDHVAFKKSIIEVTQSQAFQNAPTLKTWGKFIQTVNTRNSQSTKNSKTNTYLSKNAEEDNKKYTYALLDNSVMSNCLKLYGETLNKDGQKMLGTFTDDLIVNTLQSFFDKGNSIIINVDTFAQVADSCAVKFDQIQKNPQQTITAAGTVDRVDEKAKVEAKAKADADAKAKAEADARKKAEEEAEAARKKAEEEAEAARKKAEANPTETLDTDEESTPPPASPKKNKNQKIKKKEKGKEMTKPAPAIAPEPVDDDVEYTPKSIPSGVSVSSWYRFPQLNGGYFEMAKSLLDEAKMTEIQNAKRKYKAYEKKGAMYGLIKFEDVEEDIEVNGETKHITRTNVLADTDSAETIRDFFKDTLPEWDVKTLGNALNKFFKNRMVRVGEYYLIDNTFLQYCIFYDYPKEMRSKAAEDPQFADVVTNREPKIVKAGYPPSKISEITPETTNAYQNKHITISDMFKGRAQKKEAENRRGDGDGTSANNTKRKAFVEKLYADIIDSAYNASGEMNKKNSKALENLQNKFYKFEQGDTDYLTSKQMLILRNLENRIRDAGQS